MANTSLFSGFFENGTKAIAALSGVGGGLNAIKFIAESLEGGVICKIQLKNSGRMSLIDPEWFLSTGVIERPPDEIKPGKDHEIKFRKTKYGLRGTSGILTYTVEGTDLKLQIMWSVPFGQFFHSNRFNLQIINRNQESDLPAAFKKLENTGAHKTRNGGRWETRSYGGIQMRASMTNGTDAILQVMAEDIA